MSDGSAATVQEQFLSVLSREEAMARFRAALPAGPLGCETVALLAAAGRVLAEDMLSPRDVPPFDRSLVDGFAVRSADLAPASETAPVLLTLTGETIACGTAPSLAVTSGFLTPIATGGPIPRGADAVVMIEHTDPSGPAAIAVRRAVSPGQGIGFAGGDMAQGELILRRGARIGSREIAMLAAAGIAAVPVVRRPIVAVLSTGSELAAPGSPLPAAGIYDSNGPMVAAAVGENGGESRFLGVIPDVETQLAAALDAALADADMVILSGGTSKGAGDLTYRLVSRLGPPGIVAHGVALKPGKPLCLAVVGTKPVVILPGFPTSAMFTFHDFVVPVLRAMAGLPERRDDMVEATVPVMVPSDLGRTEFAMVSLLDTPEGRIAYPVGKGSGAVTSFAQADGYIRIEALEDHWPAGRVGPVTLLARDAAAPDLAVIGSHCVGLDAVLGQLAERGITARTVAVGSLGGLAAARRGECDLAPVHLLDPKTGVYNESLVTKGLALVKGWRRTQGVVFRRGDPRFEGRDAAAAIGDVAADPACLMVNRNAGAGTRILTDQILAGQRPEGYWNQPRSHNAVAAAVAQGRADWGVAIAPVAAAYGLGFLPLADEHYDFMLVETRRIRPAVEAFLDALAAPETAATLARLGFAREQN